MQICAEEAWWVYRTKDVEDGRAPGQEEKRETTEKIHAEVGVKEEDAGDWVRRRQMICCGKGAPERGRFQTSSFHVLVTIEMKVNLFFKIRTSQTHDHWKTTQGNF